MAELGFLFLVESSEMNWGCIVPEEVDLVLVTSVVVVWVVATEEAAEETTEEPPEEPPAQENGVGPGMA